MHLFDSIIIGIYIITLIYIGFNRTKKSRSSPEEYLLMGRRLSLPGFVASLVATWYGGILGLADNGGKGEDRNKIIHQTFNMSLLPSPDEGLVIFSVFRHTGYLTSNDMFMPQVNLKELRY